MVEREKRRKHCSNVIGPSFIFAMLRSNSVASSAVSLCFLQLCNGLPRLTHLTFLTYLTLSVHPSLSNLFNPEPQRLQIRRFFSRDRKIGRLRRIMLLEDPSSVAGQGPRHLL